MPSGGSKPLDRSIVEGPLARAVWMLAWPTMLQNLIAGLQGVVDHALVGHFVGYAGNAAIGVGIQIFIVVIVFVISVFGGMGVLVARFAGANQPEKVNRVVYQAFLTAVVLAVFLAVVGYTAAPAAGHRQRRAGSATPGAPLPARHVPRHLRHDDVLHAERCVSSGGRRSNAVAPRH